MMSSTFYALMDLYSSLLPLLILYNIICICWLFESLFLTLKILSKVCYIFSVWWVSQIYCHKYLILIAWCFLSKAESTPTSKYLLYPSLPLSSPPNSVKFYFSYHFECYYGFCYFLSYIVPSKLIRDFKRLGSYTWMYPFPPFSNFFLS